jgi:hypothetical protein
MSNLCAILAISYLLLTDICEEGINLIALFDEPYEDA